MPCRANWAIWNNLPRAARPLIAQRRRALTRQRTSLDESSTQRRPAHAARDAVARSGTFLSSRPHSCAGGGGPRPRDLAGLRRNGPAAAARGRGTWRRGRQPDGRGGGGRDHRHLPAADSGGGSGGCRPAAGSADRQRGWRGSWRDCHPRAGRCHAPGPPPGNRRPGGKAHSVSQRLRGEGGLGPLWRQRGQSWRPCHRSCDAGAGCGRGAGEGPAGAGRLQRRAGGMETTDRRRRGQRRAQEHHHGRRLRQGTRGIRPAHRQLSGPGSSAGRGQCRSRWRRPAGVAHGGADRARARQRRGNGFHEFLVGGHGIARGQLAGHAGVWRLWHDAGI